MQTGCLGIVIRTIKYGDSGIIAHIITDRYGLLQFIVKGVHSKRSKNKMSLFSPLSIVNLQMVYRENRTLHTIKEITAETPLHQLHNDIIKNSMAIYIAEVMKECIKSHSMADISLFNFLKETILQIENQKVDGYFHIKFMINLSHFLGFSLLHSHDVVYLSDQTGTEFYREDENDMIKNTEVLHNILSGQEKLSKAERIKLLENIHNHYRKHLDDQFQIKSLEVLESIFN